MHGDFSIALLHNNAFTHVPRKNIPFDKLHPGHYRRINLVEMRTTDGIEIDALMMGEISFSRQMPTAEQNADEEFDVTELMAKLSVSRAQMHFNGGKAFYASIELLLFSAYGSRFSGRHRPYNYDWTATAFPSEMVVGEPMEDSDAPNPYIVIDFLFRVAPLDYKHPSMMFHHEEGGEDEGGEKRVKVVEV